MFCPKIAIVIVAMSLIGCKDQDVSPSVEVTGLLNGNRWEQEGWSFKASASPTYGVASYPCDLGTISINFSKLNPQGYIRESLYIDKISSALGTYPITKVYPCTENANVGANFLLIGSDGDVVRAVFSVDESANNYLTIEQVDSSANRIVGKLQVTFATTPEQKSRDTPYDTVRITNCRFNIPIMR